MPEVAHRRPSSSTAACTVASSWPLMSRTSRPGSLHSPRPGEPRRDLSIVPTHRAVHEPPPSRWGWVQRPKPGGRGFTVHDHDCELAADGGAELGLDEALDAMLRPGAEACDQCDAAAVLVPMLQLGQGYA